MAHSQCKLAWYAAYALKHSLLVPFSATNHEISLLLGSHSRLFDMQMCLGLSDCCVRKALATWSCLIQLTHQKRQNAIMKIRVKSNTHRNMPGGARGLVDIPGPPAPFTTPGFEVVAFALRPGLICMVAEADDAVTMRTFGTTVSKAAAAGSVALALPVDPTVAAAVS